MPEHIPTPKKSAAPEQIRVHGLWLLIVLLVMHVIAFVLLRWFERNELRSELSSATQLLTGQERDKDADDLGPLPDGIMFLPDGIRFEGPGFFDDRSARGDFLVYVPADGGVALEKSVKDFERESWFSAIMLASLYIGEVSLVFGWWHFVREKINNLFKVT